MKTRALALFSLAVLAGCGFQPAYAPVRDATALRIGEIEGRTGHFLRQELVRALGRGVPGAANAGELTVKVSERLNYVGFRPDTASSRADYAATANWSLLAVTGDVIASGSVAEAASFNFAGLPYNDLAAENAAKERVALALSRGIRQQIILQLDASAAPAGAPSSP
jgi:LPS-assembly lipoprotein